MSILHSNIGLGLTVIPLLVHGSETMFPMTARYVANLVFPFMGLYLPEPSTFLTLEDQSTMLDQAIQAAPSEKWKTAADYIFMLTFEQRQGSSLFWATCLGAMYALTLPVGQRHPIHMLLMVLDVLMTIGNANHAGVPFLGYNPMVTSNARNLGIAFAPFWLINFFFNYVAFGVSKKAALGSKMD
eukprot:scaffold1555_cov173-Amphora_coffeaeformis.AAC.17